ncbi:MAG: winged helix-turn-helix transcriptional regulator [Dehalococcoidia bacterium]|nr:winged helix-turn-helix transcriptional regulator [Dehalococcoidia bacterium]
MEDVPDTGDRSVQGDALLAQLAALANPHRLRIVAALAGRREYVSRLAREIGLSRPLLHMHLQRLERAGLVAGRLELSADGKAMKYFEVVPFAITITPERIAAAAASLSGDHQGEA